MSRYTCVLCGVEQIGYGNNPYPLKDEGRCCDECNQTVVATRIVGNANPELVAEMRNSLGAYQRRMMNTTNMNTYGASILGEGSGVSPEMIRDARLPTHYRGGELSIPSGFEMGEDGSLTPFIPPALPSDIRGQLIANANNVQRITKVKARLLKKLEQKQLAK